MRLLRISGLFAAISLVLAACGTGPTTTTTTVVDDTTTSTTTTPTSAPTTTTTTATTTTDDREEVPRIKVEGGAKVEGPDRLSVKIGDTVRFEVEADVADEVHVHGFDLHFDTVPGREVLVEFAAAAAGIFEVELEGARLHLLDVEITP
jgi:heme/copper-type cytochrome/quinol oxidase subunit 2